MCVLSIKVPTRKSLETYLMILVYVSRKEGGTGLASIEDSVDESMQWLEDDTGKRGGRLITATRNNTNDTRTMITKKQKWEEKQLYGRFKRQTSDMSHGKTLTRLRKQNLKRETESLLIATQNNVIRTNHIKARIDKIQQNSKCGSCGDRDETITHISECSKLALSIRLGTTAWARWSTRNWARNFNLTIQTNAQPRICPGKLDVPTPLRFWDTKG